MRRMIVSLLLLLLPAAAAAEDVERPAWPELPPLTVLHRIEEHDGELLHKPWALDFDAAGLTYVLCQGDSRVRVFDADWTEAGAFGAPGEGPGEFEQAWALVVAGGEVRVFQPYRQIVFALDGTWLRTDRTDHYVTAAAAVGDESWVLVPGHGRLGVRLDAGGATVGDFGPANPHRRPAERQDRDHWNMVWRLLPRDGTLQLLDAQQGIWYAGPEPDAAVLADLGATLGRGWSRSEVKQDGDRIETLTTSWTPLVNAALDGRGRLWAQARNLGLLVAEPGETPRLGSDQESIFAVSPRGELVAVRHSAGTLTVYDLPE